jgi:hypothetical protein
VRKGKPDPRGKEKPCWSEKKDTKTETDVYLFRRIAEKGKQTTVGAEKRADGWWQPTSRKAIQVQEGGQW